MKPSLVVGPANNAKVPECGIAGGPTPVNEVSPVSVQGGKLPVSKPPLTTIQAGVPVGVGVGDPVGVGEGVPPTVVPLSRYTWSGPPAVGMQMVFTVQVGHIPKPPPGFCQAAGPFDCTVRSVQPHSPFGLKVILPCISTQYVPAVSTAGLAKLTVKVLLFCVNGWLVALKTCAPGRPPLSA